MPIHLESRDDAVLIRPTGRIDSASAGEFESVVVGKLDEGVKKLVFDFGDLDFMSSAGLRVVLLAGKRMREAKGKLAFAGMRDNVHDVFAMSGFLKLFQAHKTVDEALAAVR
ncbi:MAG TPA: STAS domain-containing protein [Usitatibacter sp.]|nr:STAS domain-containing protein [Usitatibacter sp.]